MSEERRITSEDLALYAMQLLSKEETAAVAAYVKGSEEARRELAEIQGDLAIYAHTVDLHSPPAQARERLMKQLSREKKAIPIDRPAAVETRAPEAASRSGSIFADAAERASRDASEGQRSVPVVDSSDDMTEDEQPKRGVAGKVLPWIGWAVAAGLAVAAGDLYHERDSLRDELATQASQIDHVKTDAAAEVASAQADAKAARKVLDTMTDSSAKQVMLTTYKAATGRPVGHVTYVASKGALIFTVSNLGPLQPTKTYELWLLPAAEGQNPIPAGTFLPDAHGNASVIMPQLPAGVEAKGFGVTMENEGGSTTPTLPIILVGE
jgi:Anti-sigma-K factor rskA